MRIEEAIQDIEGIEKMISTSQKFFEYPIELENGYDPQLLKDEITTRVEGLNIFQMKWNARDQRSGVATRSDQCGLWPW